MLTLCFCLLFFQLGGGESHNIGLSFLPQQVEGTAIILIFINDRDGKNEETFSVKINYTS